MRIGLNNPKDFLALVVRQRWWIIAPFVLLSCAVAVVIFVLPMMFVSEALILVRPQDVPEEFVKNLIADTTGQRLEAIQQTVLSRTNLIQILTEFGDKLPELRALDMEEKVARLRNQINIPFTVGTVSKGADSGVTYFRISYQNQNPELAQEITNKLTTLFIEQDNRVRSTQVSGITEFISGELAKAEAELRTSEDRLKQVKSSRQFELPGQLETNLRALERLNTARQANAEALDRSVAMRLTLESQIAQTPSTSPAAVVMAPLIAAAPAAVPPRNPLVEEYERARLVFEELDVRYNPGHPDYDAAKARLDRLKAMLPATSPELAKIAERSTVPTTTETVAENLPNPVYQKLQEQLQGVRTELAMRERERASIETDEVKYKRRVENTPSTEQEMTEILRENAGLQKRFEDLKDNLTQAKLAESLEDTQKGSQFVVVDAANLPSDPAKPNKLLVLLAGAGASLFVSIGLGVAVDVARQRIWTQSEVEAFWGVPILVDIPEILTDSDLAAIRKKKIRFAISSAGVAAAYSICLYLMYVKSTFVLQHLDPVLQLVYR